MAAPVRRSAQHELEVGLEIHFGEISEERLGEVSPVLLAVAADDEVADRLVERQADEVTALATVVPRRLGLSSSPVEVVLGGSARGPRHGLMAAIQERFARAAAQAKLVVVDAPPVLGAARLGLDAAGAPPEAPERLCVSYS